MRIGGRWTAAFGVVATTLVLGLSVLGAVMSSASFPAWLEGVSTFAAFLAASYAAFMAARAFRRELDRDVQRRERDEQGAQADLVAGWPDWNPGTRSRDHWFDHGWGTRIVNSSPLPVYDLTIEVFGPDGTLRHTQRRATLAPGELFLVWPGDAVRWVVPDGRLPDDWEPTIDETDNGGGYSFGIAVSFRDTAGREWRRDRRGQLALTGRQVLGEATAVVGVGQMTASGEVIATPETEQD